MISNVYFVRFLRALIWLAVGIGGGNLHCLVKGPWDDDDERVDLSFAKGPRFFVPLQLLPHLSESMPHPFSHALGRGGTRE
jgi:hypothetical protein